MITHQDNLHLLSFSLILKAGLLIWYWWNFLTFGVTWHEVKQ